MISLALLAQSVDGIQDWFMSVGIAEIQSLPWLIMVLFAVPFIIQARRRVYPTILAVLLMMIPAALAFTVLLNDGFLMIVLLADAAIFALLVVDAFLLPQPQSIEAKRD